MAKLTLEEKRIQTLRRQLLGKNLPDTLSGSKNQPAGHSFSFTPTIQPSSPLADTSYLKKDLIKIFSLSTLVLALQLALFWGLKNGALHLKF